MVVVVVVAVGKDVKEGRFPKSGGGKGCEALVALEERNQCFHMETALIPLPALPHNGSSGSTAIKISTSQGTWSPLHLLAPEENR